MAGYLGLLLFGIVFVAAGRILLGFLPGAHATKTNVLMFVVGAFFGGGMFMVLVFWVARVLHVSFNARDENTLTIFSWLICGFIGGTVVAWLMTRQRAPRKGVSR
jgi:hypothetical protein